MTAFYRLFRFLFYCAKKFDAFVEKFIAVGFASKILFNKLRNFQTKGHFEMRLEFFLVVMIVSIFQYNKLFCNLIEFCNDRFDGGLLRWPRLAKKCLALLQRSRRGA